MKYLKRAITAFLSIVCEQLEEDEEEDGDEDDEKKEEEFHLHLILQTIQISFLMIIL